MGLAEISSIPCKVWPFKCAVLLAFLLIDNMNYFEKLVLTVLCLSTNSLAGHTIGSLNSTDASLAFLVLQLLSHPMCTYYTRKISVDSRLYCYNRKLNACSCTCEASRMVPSPVPRANVGIILAAGTRLIWANWPGHSGTCMHVHITTEHLMLI